MEFIERMVLINLSYISLQTLDEGFQNYLY